MPRAEDSPNVLIVCPPATYCLQRITDMLGLVHPSFLLPTPPALLTAYLSCCCFDTLALYPALFGRLAFLAIVKHGVHPLLAPGLGRPLHIPASRVSQELCSCSYRGTPLHTCVRVYMVHVQPPGSLFWLVFST